MTVKTVDGFCVNCNTYIPQSKNLKQQTFDCIEVQEKVEFTDVLKRRA